MERYLIIKLPTTFDTFDVAESFKSSLTDPVPIPIINYEFGPVNSFNPLCKKSFWIALFGSQSYSLWKSF